jgi:hypothetical protein
MEEPKSLDSLFKEKLFRIPDYQRGYAWKPEQLKDFWEDLRNLSDDRFHYTGVLTLKEILSANVHENEKEYWLVEDHSYTLYHIVDGQQRLTTFIIFLQAFIDFVKTLPDNLGKTDNEIYITDSLSVKEVTDKYLFKIKPPSDQFRTYKFGYTEDNPSDNYLRYRILNEDAGGSIQETFYTVNLSNAKDYFSKQLTALHKDEGWLALLDIYKKLTKRFLFNEYIIKDDFDVFVAFETMNNRGKKLSDLELLKNRLIYLATLYNNEELDLAERTNLRDTINEAWKVVYSQLGRNKLKPLNDDEFLKAHWTMYFKYSRKTGRDYIRFLLDEQFTPHKVLKKVAREVALEIPEEQRSDGDAEDSENDNGDGAEEAATVPSAQLRPTEIQDFVNSLKESAVHWFNSFYPYMAEDMTSEEQQWIERLNRIGMGYFRPLVMAILKNEQSESTRIGIFKCIERFIFVAFRMMGTRANYRSSEFYNAAREIDSDKTEVVVIQDRLEEGLSFAFDADGTLKIDDFYNLLRKKFESGGGYYGWSGLRYFLYEYELSLLSENRQKKVDWSDLLKTPKDRISIEHVYPQTETPEWAEAFGEVEVDNRRYYNGTLGNLLLLSAAINSSLQNDSFTEKKKAKYNAAGEKIRNGYSDGSHSEIEVSKLEAWGPSEIYERGMKMLSFMERRWDCGIKDDEKRQSLLFLTFEESSEAYATQVKDGKALESRPGSGQETHRANTISKKDGKVIARIIHHAVRLLWYRVAADSDAFAPGRDDAKLLAFVANHLHVHEAAKHIWKENGKEDRIRKYISLGYAAGLLYLMGSSATDPKAYHSADNRNEETLDWSLWKKACDFFTAIADGSQEMQAVRMALSMTDEDGGLSSGERWAIIIKAWLYYSADKEITDRSLELQYVANEYGGRILTECPVIGGIDLGNPPEPSE